MQRRPTYIFLGLTVAAALVLLNLPARTSEQLKLALGAVFLPLFGLTSSAHNTAAKAGQAVIPRSILNEQVERLRVENEQLKIRLIQADAALAENTRLRAAIGWQGQRKWNARLGRVIGRDPANWWRAVRINLGSRDGVRENMPVLTPEGLVGRVGTVGFASSQVILVGDPNCHVAALVVETRENGVIAPGTAAQFDPSIVDLTYLSRNSRLQPGQEVWTSGLGGIFPRGIPVGVIVDHRSIDFGLYTQARVKLHVNINQLEDVWVVFP